MSDDMSNEAAEPSGEQQETSPESGVTPIAGATTAPPAETAAQRKWRLQVDGGEEETDDAGLLAALIEAHGEDGLRNITQLSKSARRGKGEVEHQKRQLMEAVSDLRDPNRRWALLEKLVGGREKLRTELEDFYARDLEERQLAPEEREKRSLGSDLEKLRREKAELEREKRERAMAEQQAQLVPQFQRDFTAALQQAGAESDPLMIADMAKYVEAEIGSVRTQAEYEQLVREAARAVAREHDGRVVQRFPKLAADKRAATLRDALKGMSASEIIDLLGEDGVRAFRKADVERVKGKVAPGRQPMTAPSRPSNGQRQKQSLDDFFTTIRNGDKI